VIFEVLIAVSVMRAVVLVVIPRGLIEIYHPFSFYHEVRGVRFPIFIVETELVASSKTFLPDFIS